MFKNLKLWYFKWFVEGTIAWRMGMLHCHWDAEQEARVNGRDFVRVPPSLLQMM